MSDRDGDAADPRLTCSQEWVLVTSLYAVAATLGTALGLFIARRLTR